MLYVLFFLFQSQNIVLADDYNYFLSEQEAIRYLNQIKCRRWKNECRSCTKSATGSISCSLSGPNCDGSFQQVKCIETMKQWLAKVKNPDKRCVDHSHYIEKSCGKNPNLNLHDQLRKEYEGQLYSILESEMSDKEKLTTMQDPLQSFMGLFEQVSKQCEEKYEKCFQACHAKKTKARMPASQRQKLFNKCIRQLTVVQRKSRKVEQYFLHWSSIEQDLSRKVYTSDKF